MDRHKQMSVDDASEWRVYRRRWFVLGVFCFYCGYQAAVWNTFAPITYSLQLALGWSDGTLALLSNWGPIAYVTLTVPFSYLFEKVGARYAVLLGTLLCAVGTALRTLTTSDPAFLALCHAGQFLNGASGIVVMSLPGLVSAIWFPEGERILATALSQSINILGVGVSSAVGPVVVPYDEQYDAATAPDAVVDDTVHRLHLYLIAEAAVAAAQFLLVLAYFPPRPPRPPSPGAAALDVKSDFAGGWRAVLRSRDAWLCCLAMSVPGGLTMGWQSVMAIQLEPLGVSDSDVGNVGFAAFFAQAAATTAVGLAMDRFRDKIKLSLIALLSASAVCFTWLALLTLEVIPYSLPQLYLSLVGGTACYFACFPLFFELEFMICPSTSEGTIGAFLTGSYNVVMLVFLLIMMTPDLDVAWMNYLVIVGTAAAVPLIALVKRPKDYVNADQPKGSED